MKDKIVFEDIFDTKSIEKVFEQTLEFDILKLMDEWYKENKKVTKENYHEKKKEQEELKAFIRETIKEEMQAMLRGKAYLEKSFIENQKLQVLKEIVSVVNMLKKIMASGNIKCDIRIIKEETTKTSLLAFI